MELYQLKSFMTVAKSQNLTRASECLHISQSALSTQIKALEEELGVLLFNRTAKGMSLTKHGDELLEHAEKVIKAADSLRTKASFLKTDVSRTLTFGLHTDPGFLKINQLCRELGRVVPRVRVSYVSSKTIQTPEMLRREEIDLGYAYGDLREKDISQQEIARVKVRIVMHENYVRRGNVMDWSDIASLPMIWTGCQCPFHDLLQEKLEEYHLKPTRTHAVDQSIMKALVVDGFGLALMREDDALRLAEHPNVTVWDQGHLSVPLKIAWLSIHDDDEELRVARETIQSHWCGPDSKFDPPSAPG